MSTDQDAALSGRFAPPMSNGEVIFEAPWQGRVFGMARALADAGLYSWDDFRAHLIGVVGEWDRSAPAGAEYPYFECFLQAFERLLAERGLLDGETLEERQRAFAARPADHDHPPGREHRH